MPDCKPRRSHWPPLTDGTETLWMTPQVRMLFKIQAIDLILPCKTKQFLSKNENGTFLSCGLIVSGGSWVCLGLREGFARTPRWTTSAPQPAQGFIHLFVRCLQSLAYTTESVLLFHANKTTERRSFALAGLGGLVKDIRDRLGLVLLLSPHDLRVTKRCL